MASGDRLSNTLADSNRRPRSTARGVSAACASGQLLADKSAGIQNCYIAIDNSIWSGTLTWRTTSTSRCLSRGVAAWNKWRRENPSIRPDLRGANLSGANLIGADLIKADLSEANLVRANLNGAHLNGAHLNGRTSAGRVSAIRSSSGRTSAEPASAEPFC